MPGPKIVVTDRRSIEIKFEEEIFRSLKGNVVFSTCSNEEELIAVTRDADAVLNSAIPIGRSVIQQMEKCKIISSYGTGIETIDMDAANEKGIYVTNVQDDCSQEVAEHVIACVLALSRKLFIFNASVRAGKRRDVLQQPLRGLQGMKLGLYGYEKAAQEIAKKATALGLEVLVHSKSNAPFTVKIRAVNFETLLRNSDFISVQADENSEVLGQIGESEFRMMKPESFFINTAEAGMVEEEVLYKALSEGWIAGAALGILPAAPPDSRSKLLELDNIIFTPHVSWLSEDSSHRMRDEDSSRRMRNEDSSRRIRNEDSSRRMREIAAQEVLRVLEGKSPRSVVNHPVVVELKRNDGEKFAEPAEDVPVNMGRNGKSHNGIARRHISTAEFIVRYLESIGVKQIFGVPGGTVTPIYRAINESGIKDVLTKHEAGAAFMADGYARISGQLGVCMATTGPGSTNLITGVASAFADSIPLLVLTGQVSTAYFGKGASQEGSPEGSDIVQMLKHVTRYSSLAFKANKVPEYLRKALNHATRGRKGPAHLSLPFDVLREEMENLPEHYQLPAPPPSIFDRESIRAAATWLLRAKRPVIILGHGCVLSDACDEVRQLAEKLCIPVATTPKAKGALPEDHLLSLGVFGFSGSPFAEWYLLSTQVDVMLSVGTSFNEFATQGWKKELTPTRALLQIDIDQNEFGKNYRATVPLCGDAKTILSELLYEIDRQRKWYVPENNGRLHLLQEMAEAKKSVGTVLDPETMYSDAVPIKTQRVMADLRASLPLDAIVFVDARANRSWATHYFQSFAPRTFISATGMASMGYGVAAAIGAKFAVPDQIVVAIIGDGGFLMNGMEVSTAVAYDKQVIWIVLNDGQHGMIYHGRKMMGNPTISTQYPMCDVAKVAEGLGARGIRIDKPGEINPRLIQEIVESGVPTVLDVRVDPNDAAPIGSRLSSLKRGSGETPV